ncbi:hypothetical protein GGR52DRAFT_494597 [Hypoxylon sp. FL1284]|nr:hypothetical protein GGR52DRAFT_494597 [Hypoxylon sp. FL1284]
MSRPFLLAGYISVLLLRPLPANPRTSHMFPHPTRRPFGDLMRRMACLINRLAMKCNGSLRQRRRQRTPISPGHSRTYQGMCQCEDTPGRRTNSIIVRGHRKKIGCLQAHHYIS